MAKVTAHERDGSPEGEMYTPERYCEIEMSASEVYELLNRLAHIVDMSDPDWMVRMFLDLRKFDRKKM